MKEFLTYIPMIGGFLIVIIAIIMDKRQKHAKAMQDKRLDMIMSDNLPLEQVVRSVLEIQLQNHEKDKWTERLIGFLMGLASSIAASLFLYYFTKVS